MRIKVVSCQLIVVSRILLCQILLATYCILPIESIAQRNKDPKPHHENLTDLRLKFQEIKDSTVNRDDAPKIVIRPAANSVHLKVNDILDSIGNFNRSKTFVDGFTIQIYSGLKKEDAMNAKKKMVEEANDLVSDLNYLQPKWRVKTGSYYTRLEAQRDLHRLKKIFSAAILVPEKVPLR
jgi:SPOR domain